jgi:hypothetical protein
LEPAEGSVDWYRPSDGDSTTNASDNSIHAPRGRHPATDPNFVEAIAANSWRTWIDPKFLLIFSSWRQSSLHKRLSSTMYLQPTHATARKEFDASSPKTRRVCGSYGRPRTHHAKERRLNTPGHHTCHGNADRFSRLGVDSTAVFPRLLRVSAGLAMAGRWPAFSGRDATPSKVAHGAGADLDIIAPSVDSSGS